jgi:hypothetical protein
MLFFLKKIVKAGWFFTVIVFIALAHNYADAEGEY